MKEFYQFGFIEHDDCQGTVQYLRPPRKVHTAIQLYLQPANPITTKSIQLQIKPKIRLLQPTRIEHKSESDRFKLLLEEKGSQSISFFNLFRTMGKNDTLLEEYKCRADEIIIVFLKFNNISHSQLQSSNIRYLSGFFFSVKFKLFYSNFQATIGQIRYIDRLDSIFRSIFLKEPQFTSNFESGNLFMAVRTGDTAYDLIIQNDVNSKGSTQWFYFAVGGLQKGVKYHFKIVNFTKNTSLFNLGMKPAVMALSQKGSWTRQGICKYQQSQVRRENAPFYYHCLSVTYAPPSSGDVYLMAHSPPYTFTRLNSLLTELLSIKLPDYSAKKTIICESICGHPIYMVQFGKVGARPRDAVIILARQHSGETPSSFVCQGFLRKLFNLRSKDKNDLRNKCQFFIFPMLNPDGVIYGNYRCNFSGVDLNRKWKAPSKTLQPQVYYVKKKIIQIKKAYDVKFVLDLHGHSKKLGAFFYSNKQPRQKVRILPMVFSQLNSKVVYDSCTFANEESKESTARIQLSLEIPEALVYTFQISFFGYSKGREVKAFQYSDLRELGRDLFRALNQYVSMQESGALKVAAQKLLGKYGQNQNLDSGSESKPDLIELNERQILQLNSEPMQIKEKPTPQWNRGLQRFTVRNNSTNRTAMDNSTSLRKLKLVKSAKFLSPRRCINPVQIKYNNILVNRMHQPIKNSLQNYRSSGALKPKQKQSDGSQRQWQF